MRRPGHRFALAIALVLLAASACREAGGGGPPPEGHVEIRGKSIAVEIADGPAEQARGLGERDALAWGTGMYFPYERPGFYAFWMKGMRFSIDIVFLRDGRIVDLHPQVPFEAGGNGPTIRPRELADAVLEVPAGYAAANGWQRGDRVRFERTQRD
ncbi:MAG: DUF192 domain-containing protein [Myxococcota bacterium]